MAQKPLHPTLASEAFIRNPQTVVIIVLHHAKIS